MKALLILSQTNFYLDTWKRSVSDAGITHIDVVSTGEDAINAFKIDNDYKLVVCEEHLYGRMSGRTTFEGLRLSRLMKCTTAFMLVASGSMSDYLIMPLRTRPDYVVTKPYSQKDFSKGIDFCLQNLRETNFVREKICVGENDEALRDCIESNSREPNSWLRNLRCEILFSSDKISEAAETCVAEIKQYKSSWAVIMLIQANIAMAQHDKAIKLIDNLPTGLKNSATVLRLLSECYDSLGQGDLSSRYLNKAITACPDNYSFYEYFSGVAYSNAQYAASLRYIIKSIEITMDTFLENEDRYSKLSKITFKCRNYNLSVDNELLDKSVSLMIRAYHKYPKNMELNLCSKIFSVFSLQHKGDVSSATKQLSKLIHDFSSVRCPLDSLTSTQLSKLSEELPISDETKRNLRKWFKNNDLHSGDEEQKDSISSTLMEKADRLFATATEHFEQDDMGEAEILIQKGLVFIPGHIGLNILLIEIFLALSAKTDGGIERLINNSFRCFERLPVLTEDNPFYERYMTIRSELQDISMVALRKGKTGSSASK